MELVYYNLCEISTSKDAGSYKIIHIMYNNSEKNSQDKYSHRKF